MDFGDDIFHIMRFLNSLPTRNLCSLSDPKYIFIKIFEVTSVWLHLNALRAFLVADLCNNSTFFFIFILEKSTFASTELKVELVPAELEHIFFFFFLCMS